MPKKAAKRKLHNQFHVETLEARQLLTADVLSLAPADQALFVDPGANLEVTYDDDIGIGTGDVTIFAGGDVVEVIDINSDAIQIVDRTLIIDPSDNLPAGASIAIDIEEGAIVTQSVAIYTEDFEGVDLIPFVDEAGGNEDGTDWSEDFPAGWDKDNTDTPEGSPVEFFGWTIFNKDSWITTAGDQARSSFTRGQGNVVVADGDEYDDATDIDPDLFNVFLTTPEISLEGVAANDAVLKFDSSFRPYPTQTGLVDVSYDDGATWTNLLTLNDETVEGGTSSLSRANSLEELPLDNPAGATALVRFGMVDAGNDWWWAIDNVQVTVGGDGDAAAAVSWGFDTAPVLSPPQNSVEVSPDANLEITFSTDVVLSPGLGDVEIRRVADDSLFETIAVASDRVSAAGPTVTIDPVNDLEANQEYYVTIDGFTIWDTSGATGNGITLFAEDFEELELQDSKLVGAAGDDVDNYVAVLSGVLDVQVAGTYTFGVNSDDGQRLAIDVNQNGFDLFNDELIFDDATHGTQVRLTTCAFEDGLQSCEGNGDPGIDLAVGEYEFEFWYFESTGGSSGEFFYGPGDLESFDPAVFAIVGDDSQGIGVTEAGITATVYRSALEDETLDAITGFDRAEDLIAGVIPSVEGFPVTGTVPTADVWNSGGGGLFRDDHALPGFPEPETAPDWTDVPPEGWTREDDLPPGGAPEYQGWTFLDKEFWIAQQGDQDRSTFTKGQGTVAVTDPDATDDFVELDPLLYQDAFLISEAIPFSGLAPNSMTLEFDSSFRPYDTMTGLVDVSFDEGATWNNLLTLVGEDGGSDLPENSLDRANETIQLSLNNPASGTVQVRWGMDEADNDWWWAFDNIRLTSPFPGNPISPITQGQWSFTTGDGTTGGDGCPSPCPEDIDGDGEVGFSDFLILSGNFGNAVDPGTMGDIDGDGTVAFADFLALSARFGQQAQQSLPAQTASVLAPTATDLVFAAVDDDADESDDEDSLGLIL